MYPAKTVAGDYYGFIELPAGEIAVVIADVSGKGVAAGLLMPSIEVALRMNAPRFPSTSDLLQLFNNVVCQVTSGLRFISLFYGKLYPQSSSLEYTNAGHNPPLLIRAGTDPSPLDKGGPVLGVLPDSNYESEKITLRQGDVLVLYTDGAVEAENPAGEQYSAERLSKTVSLHLQQNASELIETIYAIRYRLSENDLTRRRPHVGVVEEVVAPTATEPDCAEQAARWRHCLDCNESCDEGLDLVKPGEVSNYPLRYTDCARATGNPSPIVVERWRMNRAGPGHVSL